MAMEGMWAWSISSADLSAVLMHVEGALVPVVLVVAMMPMPPPSTELPYG